MENETSSYGKWNKNKRIKVKQNHHEKSAIYAKRKENLNQKEILAK